MLCSVPYTPSPMSSSLISQELSFGGSPTAAAYQQQQQQPDLAAAAAAAAAAGQGSYDNRQMSGTMGLLRGRLVEDIEATDESADVSTAAAAAASSSTGGLTTVS